MDRDRLLLDTHIVLWWLADDVRLSQLARDAIVAADEVFVSVVSVWEIVIKKNLGKLKVPNGFEQAIEDSGFMFLPVRLDHVLGLQSLEKHHKDPFDRLLLSQGVVESLVLMSHDASFPLYNTPVEIC